MNRNISDKAKVLENKIERDLKPSDQEIMTKILSYKKKYSPEELRSIISFMKDPINKLIAEKLLLSGE